MMQFTIISISKCQFFLQKRERNISRLNFLQKHKIKFELLRIIRHFICTTFKNEANKKIQKNFQINAIHNKKFQSCTTRTK